MKDKLNEKISISYRNLTYILSSLIVFVFLVGTCFSQMNMDINNLKIGYKENKTSIKANLETSQEIKEQLAEIKGLLKIVNRKL